MKTLLPKLRTGNLLSLTFLVGALLFAGLTANAQTTTFAQFVERNGTQDFVFTNNTTSADFNTVVGGSQIFFFYSNIVGLDPSLQGPQFARLTLTATTTDTASNNAGELTQPFNNIVTIAMIRETPTAPGIGTGTRTNLLTAVITPSGSTAALKGQSGGNSATFNATTPSHVVTFTSDFISFGLTTERNLGLSFSSVNPALAIGAGTLLNTFAAAATGTFASNPPPIPQVPTAAPVSVNGRVLNSAGQPIRNARVTLTEDDGTVRTSNTSTFGYFSFEDIRSGQTVVIEPSAKRYRFNARIVSLDDNVTDLDIVSNN